jgi:hypothetical protein
MPKSGRVRATQPISANKFNICVNRGAIDISKSRNVCLPRRIRTKNLLVYHAARLAEGSVSQACGFPARRVAMYAPILREPRRPLYP